MAVRISAAGQELTRALALGAQSALTMCGWLKVSVDRNTYSSGFFLDNGQTDNWGIQTGVDGTTLNAVMDGNSTASVAMTVGTWYFVCLSTSGTSGLLYYRAAGSPTLSSTIITGVTSTNVATLRLGESPWGGEWLNGCMAAVKVWTAQLSAAEALQESQQYVPNRLASLVSWHPLVKAETADYSGNARTLSGGTGTATEDGPPISWRTAAPQLILPTAATGGGDLTSGDTVNLTDAAVFDLGKAVTETAGTTDTAVIDQIKAAADALGLTDSAAIENGRALSAADVLGLSDTASLTWDLGRSAADTEGLTDTSTLSLGRALAAADSENLTDSAALALGLQATDDAGLTDSAQVQLSGAGALSFTDAEGLTDQAAFAFGKVFSDQAGLADSFTAGLARAVSAADTEALSDTALVESGRFMSVTDLLGVTDTAAMSRTTTVLDDAGLMDQAAVELAAVRTVADIVGLTDSFTITVGPAIPERDLTLAGEISAGRFGGSIAPGRFSGALAPGRWEGKVTW